MSTIENKTNEEIANELCDGSDRLYRHILKALQAKDAACAAKVEEAKKAGYKEGRESRQSEIDFLREEAYGD